MLYHLSKGGEGMKLKTQWKANVVSPVKRRGRYEIKDTMENKRCIICQKEGTV